MSSNRYREFDRKAVGGIWRALKTATEAEREQLTERLADYDPADLLNYTPGRDTLTQQLAEARWEASRATRRRDAARFELRGYTQDPLKRDGWLDRSKVPLIVCANCKRKFFGTRDDAKTCSAKCRTALYRKRLARGEG
jgi:hypothetical protein